MITLRFRGERGCLKHRPCLSLYKQSCVTANQHYERLEWWSIPASQPKDYECTFLAQEQPLHSIVQHVNFAQLWGLIHAYTG